MMYRAICFADPVKFAYVRREPGSTWVSRQKPPSRTRGCLPRSAQVPQVPLVGYAVHLVAYSKIHAKSTFL